MTDTMDTFGTGDGIWVFIIVILTEKVVEFILKQVCVMGKVS